MKVRYNKTKLLPVGCVSHFVCFNAKETSTILHVLNDHFLDILLDTLQQLILRCFGDVCGIAVTCYLGVTKLFIAGIDSKFKQGLNASFSASSLWPFNPMPCRPHSSMHFIMKVRTMLFLSICFSASSGSLLWMVCDGLLIICMKSSIFVLESWW